MGHRPYRTQGWPYIGHWTWWTARTTSCTWSPGGSFRFVSFKPVFSTFFCYPMSVLSQSHILHSLLLSPHSMLLSPHSLHSLTASSPHSLHSLTASLPHSLQGSSEWVQWVRGEKQWVSAVSEGREAVSECSECSEWGREAVSECREWGERSSEWVQWVRGSQNSRHQWVCPVTIPTSIRLGLTSQLLRTEMVLRSVTHNIHDVMIT